MMRLTNILYNVSLTAVAGPTDIDIKSISFDSRGVLENGIFLAVRGTKVDGHLYFDQAISNGAIAIVCEELPEQLDDDITYVSVKNSAIALGIMAANFYNQPSSKLSLIGITGTNGKTTIATLLYNLFSSLGYNTGLISTIENKIGDKVVPSSHTTPDPVQLNQLLSDMVSNSCTHCFMEVSSHAIDQQRVAGLGFAGAIFTNISHDHLDYHQTFEHYIKTKKNLFDNLKSQAFSLVNLDDKNGRVMQQNSKASKKTYSLRGPAQFRARVITNSIEGLEIAIGDKNVWFKLFGNFNAYNILAVYATAILLGENSDEVLTALSELDGVPGRLEKVPNALGIIALVDYAHSPDALKNVLETISGFRSGNEILITVIGCGGDRDKSKRPIMASIACQLSDKVILTSDNPRNEHPTEIIKEMQKGINATWLHKTIVLEDRSEAIKTACMLAEKGDIILVAGKGHETYQEIKGIRHPFNDKQVLKSMLNLMKN